MIRVLIVDDHPLVRHGLEVLLERMADIEVVGQAGNGEEAIELASTLTPDVVVMDVAMPRMNGFQAAERICADNKDVKILLVSVLENKELVEKGLEKGARGYLLKNALFTNLIPAIRIIHKGEVYLSPEIARWSRTLTESAGGRATSEAS